MKKLSDMIAKVLGKEPEPAQQGAGLPVNVLNALRFYANGYHFNIDASAQEFDTVSGEPDNWLHSQQDDDQTMFEDGSIARAVLQGKKIHGDVVSTAVEDEIYGVDTQYNFFQEVAKMMDYAGQGRSKFDARQYCLYMGLQFEELHEKAVRILGPSAEHEHFLSVMGMYARFLRNGIYTAEVQAAFDRDAEGLLDDDVDQLVVTYGAMESSGADIQGALKAVTDANLAKFPGGVATLDSNNKIVKPAGWKEPDLSPFVYKSE